MRPGWLWVALVPGWALLGLWRVGFGLASRSVWGEDGTQFMPVAWDHGSLLTAHNGYLHLVPRLLAVPLAAVPLEHLPIALAATGSLVTAGCAAVVAWSAAQLLPSTWARAALGTWLVLLPTAGVQVLGNITYAQWYLVAAAAWAWFAPLASRAAAVSLGCGLFLVALSAPMALILLPLAALHPWMWSGLGRARWAAASGYFAGLGIQWAAIVLAGHRSHPPASGFAEIFLERVVLGTFLGDRLNAGLWVAWGPRAYLALAAVVTAAGLTVLAWWARRKPRRSAAVVVFAGLAVVAYAFCALGRPEWFPYPWSSALPGWTVADYAMEARYVAVSCFLLTSAIAVALARLWPTGTAGRSVAVAALLALAIPAAAASFHVPAAARIPDWEEELQSGRERCVALGVDEVEVAISPAPWTMPMPCRLLLDRRP